MSAIVKNTQNHHFHHSGTMRSSMIETASCISAEPPLEFRNNNHNKYNTLTPAEVRRFTRRPMRTASVLHKPRAPTAPTPPVADYPSSQASSSPESDRFYSSVRSDCTNFKTGSKISLASSTSRALRDQFSNIRKFLRISPIRRSLMGTSPTTTTNSTSAAAADIKHRSTNQKDVDTRSTNSFSDYISDLSLNRSQSPPVFPPPPPSSGDLKSMQYMESNLDLEYSNYDEFTNLRNQQTFFHSFSQQQQQQQQVYQPHQQQQLNHNNGPASLPPRMPIYEPPARTTPTTTTTTTNTTDYGYVGECLDNDDDATLLSDTSTLHGGDSNSGGGGGKCNKCPEFERTIESLKDKLIAKEKELTDLQLEQWSSDYLIDQLKSTISRLQRENAQLKKNVIINSNVNNRVNL